jgi:hypothetical protein
MTEHTPGPWIYHGSVHEIGTTYRESDRLWAGSVSPYQSSRPYRGTICHIQSCDHIPNGISRDEARANARLIAAAPDMLDALRRCLNYIESTEGEFGIQMESGDIARAAIAKAEGK